MCSFRRSSRSMCWHGTISLVFLAWRNMSKKKQMSEKCDQDLKFMDKLFRFSDIVYHPSFMFSMYSGLPQWYHWLLTFAPVSLTFGSNIINISFAPISLSMAPLVMKLVQMVQMLPTNGTIRNPKHLHKQDLIAF